MAKNLAARIAADVRNGQDPRRAVKLALEARGVTADDVITYLAGGGCADDDVELVCRVAPLSLLRSVADLTHAVDYPETATRAEIARALPSAL